MGIKKTLILLFILVMIAISNIKAEEREKQDITIAFTGDVMLGRLVNDYVILANKLVTHVWGDMIDLLKGADLTIINLECAIARSGKPWSKTPKVFFYKADPKAIYVLKAAGIDYVTLANNHVLDYDEDAFIETLHHLEKNKILYAGAGKNISEASRPAFLEAKGIRIAIIAFTDNMPEWEATETKPGVNYIEVSMEEKNFGRLKKSIEDVKNRSDLVIISAHWGPNMRQRPSKAFKEFAHAVIDAGADIFHGHSAHIFQGIEIYRGRLIMYDTGDFVDDYAVDEDLRNNQNFLFLITLSKKRIEKIELIPGLISHMQVNRAKGTDLEDIMGKMIKLSEEMGTKIVRSNDRLEVILK
jgi:poly-gamma-glutamate synthesis protein (capsule biosynthesis protein)